MQDKDRIIFHLWKLLDDIDSLSDIIKDDNDLYRKKVTDLYSRRFDYLTEDDINMLYKKYY